MLYKHAICSCARMEQDSIVEWVEYHRSIGFEHFFIYGNDDDFRILGGSPARHSERPQGNRIGAAVRGLKSGRRAIGSARWFAA